MNSKDFDNLVKEVDADRLQLLLGKSQDYATDDVLSNFKRMNKLANTLDIDPRRSPLDCAMFLLVLKVDRWNNLKNKESIVNESIRDTVCDLHNYVDLALGLLHDGDE